MTRLVLLLAAILVLTSRAAGQAEEPVEKPGARIALDTAAADEVKLLDALLDSQHWSSRVFGLMRLERYSGDKVSERVLKAAADKDWHVRCFALRTAARLEVKLPEDALAKESDGRVIRTALRVGIDPGPEIVGKVMRQEIASRSVDRLLVAVEIGAATRHEASRKLAAEKIARIIETMDNKLNVLAGERIARVLGIQREFRLEAEWKAWLTARKGKIDLPEPADPGDFLRGPAPWIATLDKDKLGELMNYLSDLRKQDIDVVIALDATGSMGAVIRRAQSESDRLTLILNDLSKSMNLGFVAYRDRADLKPTESHDLTRYINPAREFLFGVEAMGGGDLPEAVLEGLRVAAKLSWRRSASKQIIIVGDAPSHAADREAMAALLKAFQKRGIVVHTVATSQNQQTIESFKEIAQAGGGKAILLTNISDLAKMVLQLSLDDRAKPAIEDFYNLYVMLCM